MPAGLKICDDAPTTMRKTGTQSGHSLHSTDTIPPEPVQGQHSRERRSTVLARGTCQHRHGQPVMQLQDSGRAHRQFHPPAPSPTAVVCRGAPIGSVIWDHRSANHSTTVLHPGSGPSHLYQARRGHPRISQPSSRPGARQPYHSLQQCCIFWAPAPPTRRQIRPRSDRSPG
ncbi:hypothetical protein NDU88_002368 [Pleurodeles waltl]|uniref:Uncharacterized protein n=1 Tax=Pleurodeles waltl TaxID=8319 RepID=A0AAV7Q8L1_PLEWA|nr:hypothetical protein NDU88_002368 [Pleurodeles waltl]